MEGIAMSRLKSSGIWGSIESSLNKEVVAVLRQKAAPGHPDFEAPAAHGGPDEAIAAELVLEALNALQLRRTCSVFTCEHDQVTSSSSDRKALASKLGGRVMPQGDMPLLHHLVQFAVESSPPSKQPPKSFADPEPRSPQNSPPAPSDSDDTKSQWRRPSAAEIEPLDVPPLTAAERTGEHVPLRRRARPFDNIRVSELDSPSS